MHLETPQQGRLIKLKGHVFGDFAVVRRCYPWEVREAKTRQARWICECMVCGARQAILSQNLRNPAVNRRCCHD